MKFFIFCLALLIQTHGHAEDGVLSHEQRLKLTNQLSSEVENLLETSLLRIQKSTSQKQTYSILNSTKKATAAILQKNKFHMLPKFRLTLLLFTNSYLTIFPRAEDFNKNDCPYFQARFDVEVPASQKSSSDPYKRFTEAVLNKLCPKN